MLDFLHSQETLTTIEWALRSVLAFLFLLTVAKAMGQRAISQLRVIDFVIALVIGNIIAHPLSDENLGMKGSVISTIVLMALYVTGVFSLIKWPWLRRLVNNAPITIVEDGKILAKGLRQARISIDVLLEELRERQVKDIQTVAVATWEADGKISVLLHPGYEPLTAAALQMETGRFELPRTVIKEGRWIKPELEALGTGQGWVEQQLKEQYQALAGDVLLCTLDSKGKLSVFLY